MMALRSARASFAVEEIARRPHAGRAQPRRMAEKSGSGPASRRASISVVATADVGARLVAGTRRACARCGRSRGRCPRGRSEKRSTQRSAAAGVALRQEHHDVDVGTRVQLAAAVAADGDQRKLVGRWAGRAAPGAQQQRVDELRARRAPAFRRPRRRGSGARVRSPARAPRESRSVRSPRRPASAPRHRPSDRRRWPRRLRTIAASVRPARTDQLCARRRCRASGLQIRRASPGACVPTARTTSDPW